MMPSSSPTHSPAGVSWGVRSSAEIYTGRIAMLAVSMSAIAPSFHLGAVCGPETSESAFALWNSTLFT